MPISHLTMSTVRRLDLVELLGDQSTNCRDQGTAADARLPFIVAWQMEALCCTSLSFGSLKHGPLPPSHSSDSSSLWPILFVRSKSLGLTHTLRKRSLLWHDYWDMGSRGAAMEATHQFWSCFSAFSETLQLQIYF